MFIKAIKSGDVSTDVVEDHVENNHEVGKEDQIRGDTSEQTFDSSKNEEKNKTKKSFAQIRSLNRKTTMVRNTIASGSEQQCNVL